MNLYRGSGAVNRAIYEKSPGFDTPLYEQHSYNRYAVRRGTGGGTDGYIYKEHTK